MTTLEMVATVMCCCGIVQLLRTVTSFDPCHPWHLVVLAQLVELSHPTSEIRGSNTFSSIKCIAKTKRKKKMQGMAHFLKTFWLAPVSTSKKHLLTNYVAVTFFNVGFSAKFQYLGTCIAQNIQCMRIAICVRTFCAQILTKKSSLKGS